MSTLADATTTQAASASPQPMLYLELGITLLLCIAGFYVAGRLKVYRLASVVGPRRWGVQTPIWPLLAALGAGYVGAVVGASISLAIAPRATGELAASMPGSLPAIPPAAPKAPDPTNLTNEQSALLSVLSPVMTLVAAGLTLLLLQPEAFEHLGIIPGRAVRAGIFAGVAGAVVAIPWTYFVGIVTEQVYHWVGYQHPAEHDLLRAMRDLPAMLRWTAVAGAVVMAPIVEEFAFRGLIQTTLREAFRRVLNGSRPSDASGTKTDSSRAETPSAPPDSFAPEPTGFAQSATLSRADESSVWASWLAIVATSSAFALMHAGWTQPIIFFLSIALGYVYQRTGTLWSSVTLHALFNAISTVIYLASQSN